MDVKDLIKKIKYAVAEVIKTSVMDSTEVAMYLEMFVV